MMTISTRNLKNLRQLRYTLLYKCNCVRIFLYNMMTISTRNLKNLRQLRYTLLYKCNCIYICFYIYMYTYSLLHLKSHPILGRSRLIFPGHQKTEFRNPRLNSRLLFPFTHLARQFMWSCFDRITGVVKHQTESHSVSYHIYTYVYFVHTYEYIHSEIETIWGPRGVSPRPLGSHPNTPCALCIYMCVSTHIHSHALPPASKTLMIEKTHCHKQHLYLSFYQK